MSAVARQASESLVSVLRWRGLYQPDRLAYIFASEGAGEVQFTYAELDRRARSIAVSLERVKGDCVLLLYPPGLDFLAAFLGCLYAGVVSIPLLAPPPNREDSRLNAIIEDSGARLALTVTSALPEQSSHGPRWGKLDYLATDTIEEGLAERWREPATAKETLAYLQYTSGSTSAPKGVMVTHGSLQYNCSVMQESWELSEDTVSVTWLPHSHAMGLIEGLLNPLHAGFPSVFMPPAQFIAKPIRWLQLISRFRATHSGAPNFAYDLCVQKISPEERSELDLSSWTSAYSAAEPVRMETLDRFVEFFAPCGFQRRALSPGYGLAEATLMVSATPKSGEPTVKDVDVAHLERHETVFANGGKGRLVGCGRVARGTKVSIVDPETRTCCSEGALGEIWVSGPTVAAGYWRLADKAQEAFNAFPADSKEGPFLRTGDLGYMSGGELFVSGRLKDLKTPLGKIDREAGLLNFPAGLFDLPFDSTKPDTSATADADDGLSLQDLLALNPSERAFALEQRLRRHVAGLLQMPWQQIDVAEPLGSYGLDSLKGTQLIASLKDSFGLTLSPVAIFNYPSVAELSRHLARLMEITVDARDGSSGELIVQRTHPSEDEIIAEILNAVEKVSVLEMQEMITNKNTRKGLNDPIKGGDGGSNMKEGFKQ